VRTIIVGVVDEVMREDGGTVQPSGAQGG